MDAPSLPLPPARIAKLVLVVLLTFSFVVASDLPGRSAVDAQEAIPAFFVQPDVGLVGAFDGWTPGATVTVTVGDPAVETVTGQVEDGGWFRVAVGTQMTPRTLVTVTDGTTTKTHVVALLTIQVDMAASFVSGQADPNATVNFRLWQWPEGPGGPSTLYEEDLVADDQGAWTVDLAGLGFKLNDLNFITARVFDEDGDFTAADWDAPQVVLENKDDCKNGGWRTSTLPKFRNQGQCVSFFQANERSGKN
jgi:hypothetical protein